MRCDCYRVSRPWLTFVRSAFVALALVAAGCGSGGSGPSKDAEPSGKEPASRALGVVSTLELGQGKAGFVTALQFAGNTLWIGTRSGLQSAAFDAGSRGLTLAQDAETAARFANQEITDIQAEGGRVLIGTSFGYAIHEPAGGWTGEESGRVNAIVSLNGSLLVGRSGGVEQLEPGKSWEKLQPQPPLSRNQTSAQHVLSLAVGQQGAVWAGTRFGLLQFTPPAGRWEHLFASYQDIRSEKAVTDEIGNCELAGNFINFLRYDQANDKLLVGTDIGLSIRDGKTGKWLTYTGEHTKYIVKDDNLQRVPVKGNLALPSCEVHAVLLDEGAVLVGTKAGLVRLTGTRLEVFNAERGLPDDGVNALALDAASGTLFVGTEAGLAVMGLQ
jgi:ligand-binding sensor domain-containing protein